MDSILLELKSEYENIPVPDEPLCEKALEALSVYCREGNSTNSCRRCRIIVASIF